MKKLCNFISNIFEKNKLLGGSIIVLFGSIITSVFNYLYHLFMGRMLGPVDYGILASLISLNYIFSIPVGVLNTIVLRYTSYFKNKGGIEMVRNFLSWILKNLIKVSLFGFLILIVISPLVRNYLNLNSFSDIVFMDSIILLGIFSGVFSSVLVGYLRFGLTTGISIFTSFLKILVSIISVYLGFKVFGALLGYLVSSIVGLLLLLTFLKKQLVYFNKKIDKKLIPAKEIRRYAMPVLISAAALTSMYTTDNILVKHFFSATEAGLYASLSLLGKIIYFSASPISLVMFPIISGKQAKGQNFYKVFFISLLAVFLISSIITLVYFVRPDLVVQILLGKQYLNIVSQMGLFAVFMTFYSMVAVINSFYLSISKIQVIKYYFIAAVLQIIFIYIYHQNINQVIWVNIITSALLFLTVIFYVWRDYSIFEKDKVISSEK